MCSFPPCYRHGGRRVINGMKHLAMALVSAALVVTIGAGLAGQQSTFNAPQSVASVRAGLAHDPRGWVGRPVLVRGVLSSLIPSPRLYGYNAQPPGFAGMLVDQGVVLPAPGLALLWGSPDPLLSLLRQLPLVGRYAPRPQAPRWDAPTVYRVRIERVTGAGCALPACYALLLLDAAPQLLPSLRPPPGHRHDGTTTSSRCEVTGHMAASRCHVVWPGPCSFYWRAWCIRPYKRLGAADQHAGGKDQRATHDHL